MKIESDGEEKIAVTLTEGDMQDFDITYDEMDYANIETRRVIWTILDEAKRILGKPINIDNRLLIQVSPGEDGGCILNFSQLNEPCAHHKKRLVMRKDAEPLIFSTTDYDAYLDAVTLLKEAPDIYASARFFTSTTELYIVLHPTPALTEKLTSQLCEFGNISLADKKETAQLYEMGLS